MQGKLFIFCLKITRIKFHKQGQKWEKQNKEAFYSVSSLLREEEKRCGSRAHLVSLFYFCHVPNRRNSVFLLLLSRSSFSLLHFSQNKQTLKKDRDECFAPFCETTRYKLYFSKIKRYKLY
jgi:hypothetical protein